MTPIYLPAAVIYERILRRVEVTPEGCWLFTGAVTSGGYGSIGAGRRGKSVTTHLVAVLASGRAVPDGMTVDHLCHDSLVCRLATACPHRRCVRPEHLAIVSNGANIARRWEAGLCDKGHPLTQRKRQRYCRTCHLAYMREWHAQRTAEVAS